MICTVLVHMHLKKCCIFPRTNLHVHAGCMMQRHVTLLSSCYVSVHTYIPTTFFLFPILFFFSFLSIDNLPSLLQLSLSWEQIKKTRTMFFSGVQLLQLQLSNYGKRISDCLGVAGRGVRAPRTGFRLVMRGKG